MSLPYRPEIDGLRALAVTSVVLFHAKAPGFSNGFLGVDIFFVISGFLITSIILRESRGAGFSYPDFVTRRARRILPALFTVMLVCIPFAYWLMLPDALENFGQSLLATTLSANNILLWLTTGYWDLAAEYKPLLHTWSLGVEEQFYILYPLILLLALKLSHRAGIAALVFLAILSFAFMLREMDRDPASAFYLLHCRAWQLLTGGIAALIMARSGRMARPWLAGLGLLLLLIAFVPWPDNALPTAAMLLMATIGTALYLLFADAGNRVTWPFTRRSTVFVGLVSYSFYLWHQPVFAFLRVAQFHEPAPWQIAAGIVLTFFLAVLSWHFVEKPFRSDRRVAPRLFWSFTGAGVAVTLATGLVMYVSDGVPSRLDYATDQGGAGTTIAYNERIRHMLPDVVPASSARPKVMIAGNSFARDMANILIEAGLNDSLDLFYRHDLAPCAADWSETDHQMARSLDLLIFASSGYGRACIDEGLPVMVASGIPVVFVGTKHFGHNLNPLVRYSAAERAQIRSEIPQPIISQNNAQRERFGDRFVDILSAWSDDGHTIRVTDADGVLLSTDNIHLSQAGAVSGAAHLPNLLPQLYDLANSGSPEAPN